MGVRKNLLKWGVAVAALVLLFVLPDGCSRQARGLLRELLTPAQSTLLKTSQRLREGLATVRGFGGLAEENRRLLGELVHLQAQLHLLESLDEENRLLREQLAFRDRSVRGLIAAQVVARSISGWWQTVSIDKGRRDGIFPERAVISPDGLIGRTTDVSARTAEVLLVSDPASRISAKIARTGSFGIVSGAGTDARGYPVARMRFIHKDIPVRPGDTVVTSGLGGIFPRDLLIGYVSRVEMEETGLYQNADVVPNAVLDLLDVVFVYAAAEGEGGHP